MIDRVLWLLLAAGHLAPAAVLLRPSLLLKLYGVEPNGDVQLLMLHRGVLFAAIVALAVGAAFHPPARLLASAVIAISVVGFLILYFVGGAPVALRSIAIVDALLVPLLCLAALRAWRANAS